MLQSLWGPASVVLLHDRGGETIAHGVQGYVHCSVVVQNAEDKQGSWESVCWFYHMTFLTCLSCAEEAGQVVELLPKDSPLCCHPLNAPYKTGCWTGSCSHNSNSVFLKQVYNFTSSASASLICFMFALIALWFVWRLLGFPCCFTAIIMRYNRCDKLLNCFWSNLFPLLYGVLASLYSYTHKRGI